MFTDVVFFLFVSIFPSVVVFYLYIISLFVVLILVKANKGVPVQYVCERDIVTESMLSSFKRVIRAKGMETVPFFDTWCNYQMNHHQVYLCSASLNRERKFQYTQYIVT